MTGYQQVFEELDVVGGTPVKSYVLGTDAISQASSPPEYFLTDGHGSVRMLTGETFDPQNPNALVTDRYSFDAYGMMLGGDPNTQSSASTDLLYSGEQFDSELGQQYLRARYYDQGVGRFNRVDPFNGNDGDPRSLHKYAYVHGNPVIGVDPSGMMTMLEVVLLEAAILYVSSAFLFAVSVQLQKKDWRDTKDTSGATYLTWFEEIWVKISLSILSHATTLPSSGIRPDDVSGLRRMLDSYMIMRLHPSKKKLRGLSAFRKIFLGLRFPQGEEVFLKHLRQDDASPVPTTFHVGSLPGKVPFSWIVAVAGTLWHEWQHHRYDASGLRETHRITGTWRDTYGKEVQLYDALSAYLGGLPDGDTPEEKETKKYKILELKSIRHGAMNPVAN